MVLLLKPIFISFQPVLHCNNLLQRMNDPNGLFYYQGYYHMFYQYSTSIVWTNTKYWGHAVSKDLVNWKRLPIGLYPDQRKTR
jgi:fructan beta-fructosidase